MTVTTVQLRESIAKELGIYSPEMPLSAEDADKIDEKIVDCETELRELGHLWWATNATPDACKYAMTIFVAARACYSVGKQGQGFEAGEARGLEILFRLKPPASVSTLAVDYF